MDPFDPSNLPIPLAPQHSHPLPYPPPAQNQHPHSHGHVHVHPHHHHHHHHHYYELDVNEPMPVHVSPTTHHVSPHAEDHLPLRLDSPEDSNITLQVIPDPGPYTRGKWYTTKCKFSMGRLAYGTGKRVEIHPSVSFVEDNKKESGLVQKLKFAGNVVISVDSFCVSNSEIAIHKCENCITVDKNRLISKRREEFWTPQDNLNNSKILQIEDKGSLKIDSEGIVDLRFRITCCVGAKRQFHKNHGGSIHENCDGLAMHFKVKLDDNQEVSCLVDPVPVIGKVTSNHHPQIPKVTSAPRNIYKSAPTQVQIQMVNSRSGSALEPPSKRAALCSPHSNATPVPAPRTHIVPTYPPSKQPQPARPPSTHTPNPPAQQPYPRYPPQPQPPPTQIPPPQEPLLSPLSEPYFQTPRPSSTFSSPPTPDAWWSSQRPYYLPGSPLFQDTLPPPQQVDLPFGYPIDEWEFNYNEDCQESESYIAKILKDDYSDEGVPNQFDSYAYGLFDIMKTKVNDWRNLQNYLSSKKPLLDSVFPVLYQEMFEDSFFKIDNLVNLHPLYLVHVYNAFLFIDAFGKKGSKSRILATKSLELANHLMNTFGINNATTKDAFLLADAICRVSIIQNWHESFDVAIELSNKSFQYYQFLMKKQNNIEKDPHFLLMLANHLSLQPQKTKAPEFEGLINSLSPSSIKNRILILKIMSICFPQLSHKTSDLPSTPLVSHSFQTQKTLLELCNQVHPHTNIETLSMNALQSWIRNEMPNLLNLLEQSVLEVSLSHNPENDNLGENILAILAVQYLLLYRKSPQYALLSKYTQIYIKYSGISRYPWYKVLHNFNVAIYNQLKI